MTSSQYPEDFEPRQTANDLPTVELVDGAYYWVKHRYENPDLWTVAQWHVGCFGGINGNEFSPGVISGPIPRPVQSGSEPAHGTGRDPSPLRETREHKPSPNPEGKETL